MFKKQFISLILISITMSSIFYAMEQDDSCTATIGNQPISLTKLATKPAAKVLYLQLLQDKKISGKDIALMAKTTLPPELIDPVLIEVVNQHYFGGKFPSEKLPKGICEIQSWNGSYHYYYQKSVSPCSWGYHLNKNQDMLQGSVLKIPANKWNIPFISEGLTILPKKYKEDVTYYLISKSHGYPPYANTSVFYMWNK